MAVPVMPAIGGRSSRRKRGGGDNGAVPEGENELAEHANSPGWGMCHFKSCAWVAGQNAKDLGAKGRDPEFGAGLADAYGAVMAEKAPAEKPPMATAALTQPSGQTPPALTTLFLLAAGALS